MVPSCLSQIFLEGRDDHSSASGHGQHEFDQLCANLDIEHRLTPPMRPQTNGMVERLNGRIEDVLQNHRFQSGELMLFAISSIELCNRSAQAGCVFRCGQEVQRLVDRVPGFQVR